MINIVNKRKHKATSNDFLIGRPSPLGNIYSHMDNTLAIYKVSSRDEAVDKYELYLLTQIADKNIPIIVALNEIIYLAINGDVNLVCWCAPAKCHGDIIKKIVEPYVKSKTYIKY